ncbi:hypothetical protein Tco_0300127 [Tanacetum coccineum]
MGPQSMTTAHLCTIDKDCEDFEGPILAQLQPISAIFWATAKTKTVNEECQIQDLVDKKKVIIIEKSVRSSQLWRAKTIAWNEFSSTMASSIIYNKEVYVTPSHTKKVFANMKRPGKGFSGRVTPLFPTMMVQAPKDMGEDSAAPSDSHSTPIISQPSSSKPQKKKSRRKQRKDSGPTELEDASKTRGGKIVYLVADAQEKEVAKKEVSTADLVTTAGEVVTTANVEATTINAPTTTIHELTLLRLIIENQSS